MMKILLSIIVLSALSGCASNFTSINPADKEGQYYLTEITAGFPVISSDLYLCEAKSNEKMLCEEVD